MTFLLHMYVVFSSLKTRHVADIEPEGQNLFEADTLGEIQFFPDRNLRSRLHQQRCNSNNDYVNGVRLTQIVFIIFLMI